MNNSNLVYRIIREADWKEAKLSGKIPATPIDKASGFDIYLLQIKCSKPWNCILQKRIGPCCWLLIRPFWLPT